jgi:hypothetical protein
MDTNIRGRANYGDRDVRKEIKLNLRLLRVGEKAREIERGERERERERERETAANL